MSLTTITPIFGCSPFALSPFSEGPADFRRELCLLDAWAWAAHVAYVNYANVLHVCLWNYFQAVGRRLGAKNLNALGNGMQEHWRQ